MVYSREKNTRNHPQNQFCTTFTLREKCPYSELFWFVFSNIRTEYGEIRSISPYSALMRENMDQNNSEYGHFLRSVSGAKFSTHNANIFIW